MAHHQNLTDIAAQIADGQAVDWSSVRTGAEHSRERQLISRMEEIERLAQAHTAWSAATHADDEIGSSWGALTIVEKVGSGTFGDVYRAWDPRLARHVALKILRRRVAPELGTEPTSIEEARMMARVRHPNVVTVFGAERIDGRVGIWMEFVRGRTLEHEVRENGPLSENDVSAIASDLCGALAAVHAAGMLHRDLKAQNVMRAADRRILLTDFGAGSEEAYLGSDLAGTPLYLAPEMLNGAGASVRTDLYSLGVLLFYLSTGEFPISGRTLVEIRAAHTGKTGVDREPLAHLSRPLAGVIEKLLSPNPEGRPIDADDTLSALAVLPTDKKHPVWAALLIGCLCLGIAIYTVARGQNALQSRLNTIASLTAANALAPLAFNDKAAVAIVLEQLKADSQIEAACVHSSSGQEIAGFDKERQARCATPVCRTSFPRIAITREIRERNRVLGTLCIIGH